MPVLIVEDDLMNFKLLSRLLKKLGYATDHAENGEVGCRMFQQGSYRIVFMDVAMPVMDGIEATRRIRALPTGKDIPIVAVTANALKVHKDECFSAGMNDYLTKPVSIGKIEGAMQKWFRAETLTTLTPEEITQTGVVDPRVVKALRAVDEGLLDQLKTSFHKDFQVANQRIREAIGENDLQKVSQCAQWLQDSADVVGLPILADLCRKTANVKSVSEAEICLLALEAAEKQSQVDLDNLQKKPRDVFNLVFTLIKPILQNALSTKSIDYTPYAFQEQSASNHVSPWEVYNELYKTQEALMQAFGLNAIRRKPGSDILVGDVFRLAQHLHRDLDRRFGSHPMEESQNLSYQQWLNNHRNGGRTIVPGDVYDLMIFCSRLADLLIQAEKPDSAEKVG